MVKIDIVKERNIAMDKKNIEKIQIYPSKQQHNTYSKIMPKLTKTIMSPLTTMPTKKLMIAASPLKFPITNAQTANENGAKKEANEAKLPTETSFYNNNTSSNINITNAVASIKNEFLHNNQIETAKAIPSPMSDKVVDGKEKQTMTTTTEKSNEKSKETAGYRSEKEKITLGDVHPYITCFLCKGYLIEATTIVECLHTYCHSCLMKHLCREKCCPQCGMSINKSKTNIKYDATIQSIVYKLVPGLYEKELLRRRAFYKQRPDEAKLATPEERGDDTEHLIFSPSDMMSLSLDYAEKETLKGMDGDPHVQNLLKPRFLNCPAIFKVEYLKKYIQNKFFINCKKFNVEISYKVKTIVLPEHYTLMDVAYIYTWKKEAPMPFFFRIIAKNSRSNELPEVSLRRSPTSVPNILDDNTAPRKKSVSFKEDVESVEIKAEKDAKEASGVSKSSNESKKSQEQPRVESIKLKFDVSNNNVSIIKPNSSPNNNISNSTSKIDVKLNKHQRSEKKEKKSKLENAITESNDDKSKPESKKDEYEFDDEIEKQKLGFLNTFQLTAKKMLAPKYTSQNSYLNKANNKREESKIEEGKNVAKSTENNANKRKSKEPTKAEKSKKYKFNGMKSVGEDNKFLFTKTGDGHEITFDMSPKPLGSKPPLSKVKSDILLAQQRADAKAIQSKAETNAGNEKPQVNNKQVPLKPKKLPLLLPKQSTQPTVTSTSIAPTSMSPTAFVIQKPDIRKDKESSETSEISVTKINDQNHHYKVYGPKSPESKPKDVQFKSPDVFAQPLPPKPKINSSPIPPTTLPQPSSSLKTFGFGPKQPKNIQIPENMQTPYGCRTPFYVPSSPSYTPNFDPKPQFKYANPNAYASFMQSMFSPTPEKVHSPINALSTPKSADNSRKRQSTESPASASAKRKSPSPTKAANGETDSKTISILNKINFPSSLSVTLTNEQEENKKEQLRSQKQNVNNNIEIIKISEEKDAKTKSPSPPKVCVDKEQENKTKQQPQLQQQPVTEKKIPELKKLSPILPAPVPPAILPPVAKALSDSKESFQRAFLESLMSVANKEKTVEKTRKSGNNQKNSSPESTKQQNEKNSPNELEIAANKESKSDLNTKKNSDSLAAVASKKNLSLTPPLSKNVDKSNTAVALKPLTPPPISLQDHSIFSPQAVAASSAMQFNLMLNALNAAAAQSSPHFAFPDYANIQRTMLLETLRKNVEKSSALLAMHHQMQHQHQNQKNSPNSPSSSSKH